jgi:hypothetical protein
MVKVKTFTSALEIFRVSNALADLDQQVNEFLAQEKAKGVVSVSDTHTTDQSGATIGLIRVLAYEV